MDDYLNNEQESGRHLKFLIIGSSAIGKTSLLFRFTEDKFYDEVPQTIGVEFAIKNIQVDGDLVKIRLWDTAGQEKFRAITRSYYRNTDVVVLVYDITNRDSFNSLDTWYLDATNLTPPDTLFSLLGNKKDLAAEMRDVTYDEGQNYAAEKGIPHFEEVSALNGENVEEIFYTLAREAYARRKEKAEKEEAMSLSSSPPESNAGCC